MKKEARDSKAESGAELLSLKQIERKTKLETIFCHAMMPVNSVGISLLPMTESGEYKKQYFSGDCLNE